ncbi:MAG TPA: plasmid related protein [Methylomirabilota bacterium]
MLRALGRHVSGDWGNVCSEDAEANEAAVNERERLLSSYATRDGVRFWIITEADRSLTTVLLPEAY